MFWKRKSRNDDLNREIRSHLDLEAEEQQANGLSPEDARYAAKRALGNETLVKEDTRKMWRWNSLERLGQDFRYAFRVLRKNKGFAIAAILTLALGIGASTAVFTVVDSVLLKPLSFRNSGRLVALWESYPGSEPIGPNARHANIWQKRTTVFQGIALEQNRKEGLSVGASHPRVVDSVHCDPNLFDVLQVSPMLGHDFRPEDGIAGRDRVAILTYSLWQSAFHGDPNIIGETVRLADIPREVIGVLPPSFHFPNGELLSAFHAIQPVGSSPQPAIFVPAVIDLSHVSWNGEYGNWVAIARLKPAVSIQQATAQLDVIQAQIQGEMPASAKPTVPGSLSAFVQPLRDAVVGESEAGLWLLMAAVLGLMLIACLNLANAQLGRALSRQRDAAVRVALGASKARLLWHSLTENLLLAAGGGLLGVLLAVAGVNLYRHYSPIEVPRFSDVHLNWVVLLFAAGLTIASSLLFGVLPGLRFLRADPQVTLQQSSGRTLGGRHGRRIRNTLIGLQVFGCTVLLLVTALFTESLIHLLSEPKGFDTGHVALAEVHLPYSRYAKDESRTAFDDAVLSRLRGIPGVQSAGLVSAMPLAGQTWINRLHRVDRPGQKTPPINQRWASTGYFEAMRQRLVAGRFFQPRDRYLHSAILSEGEAKALWGNKNPIGSYIEIAREKYRVIGIVGDSKVTSLKTAPAKMAYLYYDDQPPYTVVFVARSKQPANQLISSLRQAIWSYAPDLAIMQVKTLDSQLSDSLAAERFQTLVLVSFGVAALLLAMLGIYGVLSYSTEMRKQEIGMRMALGATRRSIYSLILGEAGRPVIAGLIAGLFASIFAARLVSSLLYGVQGVDAPAMLFVGALFLSAAVAAAFLPARRAASVDPMTVLRHE